MLQIRLSLHRRFTGVCLSMRTVGSCRNPHNPHARVSGQTTKRLEETLDQALRASSYVQLHSLPSCKQASLHTRTAQVLYVGLKATPSSTEGASWPVVRRCLDTRPSLSPRICIFPHLLCSAVADTFSPRISPTTLANMQGQDYYQRQPQYSSGDPSKNGSSSTPPASSITIPRIGPEEGLEAAAAISLLQAYCVKTRISPPDYQITGQPPFTCKLTVADLVFQSGGFANKQEAKRTVTVAAVEHLRSKGDPFIKQLVEKDVDYVSKLQLRAQAGRFDMPMYEHQQHSPSAYTASVLVAGQRFTTQGTFPTKAKAKQEAARIAFEKVVRDFQQFQQSYQPAFQGFHPPPQQYTNHTIPPPLPPTFPSGNRRAIMPPPPPLSPNLKQEPGVSSRGFKQEPTTSFIKQEPSSSSSRQYISDRDRDRERDREPARRPRTPPPVAPSRHQHPDSRYEQPDPRSAVSTYTHGKRSRIDSPEPHDDDPRSGDETGVRYTASVHGAHPTYSGLLDIECFKRRLNPPRFDFSESDVGGHSCSVIIEVVVVGNSTTANGGSFNDDDADGNRAGGGVVANSGSGGGERRQKITFPTARVHYKKSAAREDAAGDAYKWLIGHNTDLPSSHRVAFIFDPEVGWLHIEGAIVLQNCRKAHRNSLFRKRREKIVLINTTLSLLPTPFPPPSLFFFWAI
ncbi:uncharacterized protein EV422DRAFT_581873 [Fimicolochytrium jonesii]|uniref:uncharacterized protein n=1 Tax=Fimicolochytrium jonesii TaxID=1396493 RepID=UPI0022FF1084|nr:uncharacterized protein EV422DRAFT_581873 [Fimicolochytrium jonesii]KAI8815839.1 hypothetical protein EV422DRAFT_581873 [Fimicolochytrium jonesii]